MQEKDSVTLDRIILQDQSYKSRHFIFEQIIRDREVGTIKYLDIHKSDALFTNLYWVKFAYASILIEEKYLIKVEEEIVDYD